MHFFISDIKQTLKNFDLFNIFKRDKRILLFLFDNQILAMDKQIYNRITEPNKKEFQSYASYFYPEIKPFIPKQKRQKYKKEFSKYKDFNDKRQN